MIHVSGKMFGYLATEKEYENYRLSVEFKWGEKRLPPRASQVRDADILYHCIGPDRVWMRSLACQIQEKDCGDMWLTAGEASAPPVTVRGKRDTDERVVKFADYERPHGEWNLVQVVCKGNTVRHFINGKLCLEGSAASLTRGRIDLQSEGAEIYYRNVTLEPLD